MSKYACTPSNAVPYNTAVGFVVDATPLTRISVDVTPGWFTGGNVPLPLTVPVVPEDDVVVVFFDDLPLAVAATASTARTATHRARMQAPPLTGVSDSDRCRSVVSCRAARQVGP